MLNLKYATPPHLKYSIKIYFLISYKSSIDFSLIPDYEYLQDLNLASFSIDK